MKRRTVLATVGGLAVGTSVASLAGAKSDDPDCEPVEIVVAKSGDEAAVTEEVPKAWKEQNEYTREVHEELTAEYRDASWYESSGIRSGDREICGQNEAAIFVRASDPDAASAELGEEYQDVQVEIEESDRDLTLGSDAREDGQDADDDPGDDSIVGDAPGFGALGALGGLVGAGYLYVRRRAR